MKTVSRKLAVKLLIASITFFIGFCLAVASNTVNYNRLGVKEKQVQEMELQIKKDQLEINSLKARIERQKVYIEALEKERGSLENLRRIR